MGYRIVSKEKLAPSVWKMEFEAPLVAKHSQAGEFVIVIPHEKGERIPLTLNRWDPEKGTITLVVQEVGKSTKYLSSLKEGDEVPAVLGPLGKPAEVPEGKNVVFVAGGVGAAVILPEVYAYHKAGNKLTTILGARSSDYLLFEDEFSKLSELIITTDDGSKGRKGLVTDALREVLESDKVDLVVSIGPVIMMKFVSELTKQYGVKTIVSLNPIMVDGTGMCGACRVTVGGEVKFACVDGPEFDGHLVDFDELIKRNKRFRNLEMMANELFEKQTS